LRNIAELGGANSCFVDRICAELRPDSYTVVDTNAFGLSRLAGWTPPPGASTTLRVRQDDVRSLASESHHDTVFSVGLIEHFDREGTREVLGAHFNIVRPGGAVVVSYPTPTWLYRATRRLLEALGLWRFPDERPVGFTEVADAAAPLGELVMRRTLWPLILTQELVVFVKR
jgi:hypothetical protein